MEKESECIR